MIKPWNQRLNGDEMRTTTSHDMQRVMQAEIDELRAELTECQYRHPFPQCQDSRKAGRVYMARLAPYSRDMDRQVGQAAFAGALQDVRLERPQAGDDLFQPISRRSGAQAVIRLIAK